MLKSRTGRFPAIPQPAALALCLFTMACGPDVYREARPGSFEGSLFVMWVGEGTGSGDGRFVYVPNPRDRLTFRRAEGLDYPVIVPQMMYTDGGSIPSLARGLKGFSPWGYAPAYMVHDWLFQAHHCNAAGLAEGPERDMAGMEFLESARVIAEAIRTLIDSNVVAPNDVAPRVIAGAVAGPIARAAWNRPGACPVPRVSEADRKAAEAAIPGAPEILSGEFRVLRDGRRVPLEPGRIVSVIEF